MTAEFNFMVDPEAAQIVLEETKCNTEEYGWELCGLETTVSWVNSISYGMQLCVIVSSCITFFRPAKND